MLKTAYLYQEELNKKISEIAFSPKYMFYNFATYWNFNYKLADSSWQSLQFVSVNKENNVIGFFTAEIHRDFDKICNLGIINFQERNLVFSYDLKIFLDSLFVKFNYRKIEFSVVVGNPIENAYDKITLKYGGRIVGIQRESAKLMDQKYYDLKMYEIFKSDYEKARHIVATDDI